jgi:hypothetical protein
VGWISRKNLDPPVEAELFFLTSLFIELIDRSMHYERAALLSGFDNGVLGKSQRRR